MKISKLIKQLKRLHNTYPDMLCCIAIEENNEVRIYPMKGIGIVESKDHDDKMAAIFIQETIIEKDTDENKGG